MSHCVSQKIDFLINKRKLGNHESVEQNSSELFKVDEESSAVN